MLIADVLQRMTGQFDFSLEIVLLDKGPFNIMAVDACVNIWVVTEKHRVDLLAGFDGRWFTVNFPFINQPSCSTIMILIVSVAVVAQLVFIMTIT